MQKLLQRFFKGFRGKQGGYALITALVFFLTASAAVIASISDAVFRETRIVRNEASSKQSYFLAEAGAEDIAYRIKENRSYDSQETYTLGNSSTLVTIGTNADGDQEIASTGDAGGTKRTVKIVSVPGFTTNFSFALQGGIGGIYLDGGSSIQGDIYTTGSIHACGSCTITGAAVAAGKSTSALDQYNYMPPTPSSSLTFGSSNSTQDFAQSFQVSTAQSIVDLELFIKKVGSPSNATVRITTDNGGKPSNTILASGTLSSSLITTSYSWTRISLTANPVLTPATTYWVLVDANTSSSNYYTIAANSGSTYTLGEAKYGRYNNNSWTTPPPPGLDGYFKIYLGENEDGITGENQWNRVTVSSAYSYESSYVNATGDLYCQIGTDNNKACDTSRADPAVQEYPMSDEFIASLKSRAETVHVGNYVATNGDYLYGKKIEGNLTISNGRTVYLGGVVWVTGTVTINGGAEVIHVGGDESSVLISDGTVTLSGGAEIVNGSGGGGSGGPAGGDGQIIILSLQSDIGNVTPAITINGGADDTVVFAPNGTISISGGATVNAAAAKTIYVDGGSTIIYDPLVSALNITSDGSTEPYAIKSWKETD